METFKPSIRAIINTIFKKWNIKISINDIYEMYSEFYHTHYQFLTKAIQL